MYVCIYTKFYDEYDLFGYMVNASVLESDLIVKVVGSIPSVVHYTYVMVLIVRALLMHNCTYTGIACTVTVKHFNLGNFIIYFYGQF